MNAATFVLDLGVLGVAVWALLGPLRTYVTQIVTSLDALREADRGVSDGFETEMRGRLVEVEDAVDRLPKKWAEIKADAKSYYGRANHHVGRVRKELEERGLVDDELDSLAGDIQREYGGRGPEGGVSPMRESVEGSPPPVATAPEPPPDDYLTLGNRRKGLHA